MNEWRPSWFEMYWEGGEETVSLILPNHPPPPKVQIWHSSNVATHLILMILQKNKGLWTV